MISIDPLWQIIILFHPFGIICSYSVSFACIKKSMKYAGVLAVIGPYTPNTYPATTLTVNLLSLYSGI